MPNTWDDLDTPRGKAIEMAAALRHAWGIIVAVKRDAPPEHPIGDLLDPAITGLAQAANELDWAVDHAVIG